MYDDGFTRVSRQRAEERGLGEESGLGFLQGRWWVLIGE